MSVGWGIGTNWFFWGLLSSVFVVWSVQQAWRWSACYVALIQAGWPPTITTLTRAWVSRASAERCAALLWWMLSVWAVLSVLWVLFWKRPATGIEQFVYWLCWIAVPALLIVLGRIDARVFLLPDPLLLFWAALGGVQSVLVLRWPGWLALSAWCCFFGVVGGLRYGWRHRTSGRLLGWFFQWLGAGDIKFLWAAFFWLPQGKVVLMWIYTAAFCWMHHGWQQRRLLPRGHTALGPHLILSWWVVVWVHPAAQYGYILLD
ncbi:MAG TPA: prepilin peptidase [Paenalcaligenes sp.]|nr:prepilin peptidase [Paenalcaligenes sp.]